MQILTRGVSDIIKCLLILVINSVTFLFHQIFVAGMSLQENHSLDVTSGQQLNEVLQCCMSNSFNPCS